MVIPRTPLVDVFSCLQPAKFVSVDIIFCSVAVEPGHWGSTRDIKYRISGAPSLSQPSLRQESLALRDSAEVNFIHRVKR